MKTEDFLPDNENDKVINGTKIRKGTVGTLIANLQILEQASSESCEYQEALQDAKQLYATLRSTGMTDYVDLTNPKWRNLLAND